MTLPNTLTVGRVVTVPIFACAYLSGARHVALGLFVMASLTDFLDGYIARKMNQMSAFGAFLDPVADKLMVVTALVVFAACPPAAVTAFTPAWVLPGAAVAVGCREIAVSAVRELAATRGPVARKAMDVNSLGKLKTTAQMGSLNALLWVAAYPDRTSTTAIAMGGVALLGVAVGLTIWSMMIYFQRVFVHLNILAEFARVHPAGQPSRT